MGMVEAKVREDDLNPLPSVTPEFVVAIHGRAVGGGIVGGREGPVLLHVAPEYPIARRA